MGSRPSSKCSSDPHCLLSPFFTSDKGRIFLVTGGFFEVGFGQAGRFGGRILCFHRFEMKRFRSKKFVNRSPLCKFQAQMQLQDKMQSSQNVIY